MAELVDIISDYYGLNVPERHGAVGDGTTNDTTAVAAAIAAGPVHLPYGKDYLVRGLSATTDCIISGPGRLITDDTNSTILNFDPAWGAEKTITAIADSQIVNYLRVSRITVDASGLARGDIVRIYSADEMPLPGRQGTCWKAELAFISRVAADNTWIELDRKLYFTPYTTTPRLRKLPTQRLELDINIGISGDNHDRSGTFILSMINAFGAVNPKIKVKAERSFGQAVAVFNCWAPRVDCTFNDMGDDPAAGLYVYAVNVSGATAHADVVLHGAGCRHGITTAPEYASSYSSGSYKLYGAPVHLRVHDSYVTNAPICFDLHDHTFWTVMENCHAINPMCDPNNAAQVNGFNNRGFQTTFRNCTATSIGGYALAGFVCASARYDWSAYDDYAGPNYERYEGCSVQGFNLGWSIDPLTLNYATSIFIDGCRYRGDVAISAWGCTFFGNTSGTSAWTGRVSIRNSVSEQSGGVVISVMPITAELDNVFFDCTDMTYNPSALVYVSPGSGTSVVTVHNVRAKPRSGGTFPGLVHAASGHTVTLKKGTLIADSAVTIVATSNAGTINQSTLSTNVT
jgi:hypothetical protein